MRFPAVTLLILLAGCIRVPPPTPPPPTPTPLETPFRAVRLGDGPILHPGMPGLEGADGANINGPSLLRVPDWVSPKLGRYYLYFAHHRGKYIRLAYADRLEGPWTVHAGVLFLKSTDARDHIASPDVLVDEERREIRMYFHGPTSDDRSEQATWVATSRDGLGFEVVSEPLGPPYFRVFRHGGWFYAVAKKGNESGVILRSRDGLTPFERGPEIVPRMRHAAVLQRGRRTWLLFSRIGDAPESILMAPLDLSRGWPDWAAGEPAVLLAPEKPWEGAGLPVEPSVPGGAWEPRRQLRDPAVFVEGKRAYLLYSVAGERGIALAELRGY